VPAELVACPHCQRTVQRGFFNRFHGDRCKVLKEKLGSAWVPPARVVTDDEEDAGSEQLTESMNNDPAISRVKKKYDIPPEVFAREILDLRDRGLTLTESLLEWGDMRGYDEELVASILKAPTRETRELKNALREEAVKLRMVRVA
jgi:hypothetical protein